MKTFSIETALGAGFRLIRREPWAVLMWGLTYFVMTLVIQAIAAGPALAGLLTGLLSGREGAVESYEHAATAGSLVTLPLVTVLSIAAYAVIYGAIARAELHPEDRRFFFLRLSRRELWVAVSYLVLALIFIVLIVALWIPVGVTMSMAGAFKSTATMIGWGLLLGLPALAALLYIGARFSMVWLMAFEEERFILLDSWRLTKGHGWRLVLLSLALVFMLIIASLAVVLAVLVVVAGGALAVSAMGSAGVVLIVIGVLLALALYIALFGAMYAMLLAPYIEAYRGLRGGADPDVAETFT